MRAAARSKAGVLRVSVSSERGAPVSAGGLAGWLRRVAPASVRGTVNIALVSDACVRALNRAYRGKDRVTDVLSFPAGATDLRVSNPRTTNARATSPPNPQSPISNPHSEGEVVLGDVVIARGRARQQARQAGHSESIELRVLALHGLLHLIGYDHERDNGEMRRVEDRLRRKGGLRGGLIERAQP